MIYSIHVIVNYDYQFLENEIEMFSVLAGAGTRRS